MGPEWRWMGAQAEAPETKVQEWCRKGPPSTRYIGRYEVGRTLGEGTSAHVRFARNRDTQEAVAIKIIDKQRISKHKMIKREISTMQLIKHQNVVQLLEVIASKTKVYIVLEYVDGGELFDKIFDDGRLCEEEARKYFQQLIKAVDYCHSRGVYHRDLKPENLLLDGHGNLKVSDFGLSALSQQCSEDGLLHTTCGTPNYVAPEVINSKGYDGAPADVWSCGIILYVLLAGYLPFDEANHITLYQKMNQASFIYPTWISNEAQKLITRILDPNPKTRMTIPEILADDWFGYGYTMAQTCERDIDLDDLERVFFDSKEEELEKSRPTLVNAFEIISMSRGLNLSGLFKEQKGLLKKETRFTSAQPAKVIIAKIQDFSKSLGFKTKEKNYRVKLQSARPGRKGCLSIASEVLEVSPSLHIVNMKKTNGDTLEFNDFQEKLRVGLRDVVWNNEEEIGDL